MFKRVTAIFLACIFALSCASCSYDKVSVPINSATYWAYARAHSEGLAAVNSGGSYSPASGLCSGGKWGYVDSFGDVAIKLVYDFAGDFCEGFAVVGKDGLYTYIDKNGKQLSGFIYEEAYNFSEGLALAKKDGKWLYIDTEGNVVIDASEYSLAYDFSDGLAIVCKDGEYLCINSMGEVAWFTEPEYTIYSFNNGSAPIELNGQYGIINKSGTVILAPLYDMIGRFSNGGVSWFLLGGLFGFISSNGTIISAAKWDWLEATDFSNGFSRVRSSSGYGIINEAGQMVLQDKWENIAFGNSQADSTIFAVSKNGKWGYILADGTVLVDFVWDTAEQSVHGVACVSDKNGYTFIDILGHE